MRFVFFLLVLCSIAAAEPVRGLLPHGPAPNVQNGVAQDGVAQDGVAQNGGPDSPPRLRDDGEGLGEAASWSYLREDGSSCVITQTPLDDGKRWALTRRDEGEAASVRGSSAQIAIDSPWRVVEAVGTWLDSHRSGRQRVFAESPSAEKFLRSWESTVNGASQRREEPLPAPPTTELGLAFSLRGVPWEYGLSFSVPLLWQLDRVAPAGNTVPEPLRRAHLRCTGRETIEVQSRRIGCWRVIVESQGRTEPIRAVYWISARAPYLLERLEEPDGSTLERIEIPAPEASESELPGSELP